MASYLVVNYDFAISNAQEYQQYVAEVMPTLEKHGAEVLAADFETESIEGQGGAVTIVLKFASKEAIKGWYESPEYQEIMPLRTNNTKGNVFIANEADFERTMAIVSAL